MKSYKSYIGSISQKALVLALAAAVGMSGVPGGSVPVRAQENAGGIEAAQPDTPGQPGEAAQADTSGQPGDTAQPDTPGQPGEAAQADTSGQPGGADQADTPGQPGDTAQPDTPDKPGDADEPVVPDQPDDTKETTCTDKQGVIYTFSGKKNCYVSGYTEDIRSSVKIPETIKAAGNTYQVKGIAASALKKCTALQSLKIPNSVTNIEADAFKGCKNLKNINIVPVKYTQKTSGKNAIVNVKADGALLTTAADVTLEIGADLVEKAVSGKKTDTVTLQIVVRDNAKYQVKDALPDDIILQKKAVKAIAGSGKGLKASVKNAQGSSYSIRADAVDLKQLSGDFSLVVERKQLSDTTGTVKTDLKKAFQKNKISAGSVEILSWSFEEKSKANINIVFPVKGAKAGSDVYVYRYDKAKRVFAAVSFHPYTVSRQGTVTLSISKGGTFLATKKSLAYMSRKPANEFLREGGSTYYVDQNGNAVRGWKKIGSEYYYFDRENGRMAVNTTVDSVKLSTDGTAKQTKAGVARIQTMIKARAVVEKVTKPADSITVKREKCFRWVFQFPYRRYRRLQPIYKQPGWEVTFANDIFDHHQGCCVSDAAAVAFLFHECGYKTVYVACDTSHAWVELDGRVFDPLFAEGRGFSKYYNIPYSSYYMSKPVLKRKI